MATILVADDQEDVRRLVSHHLQGLGFDVVTANDGEQAIELAAAHRADLAILDMNMPILDGWEATRQIRGSEDLSDLPIIALTGYALPGDQQRALDSGCNAYIAKPIDFDALFQMILDLLHSVPEKQDPR